MPTLIVSAAATLARAVLYGEIVVGMVAVEEIVHVHGDVWSMLHGPAA